MGKTERIIENLQLRKMISDLSSVPDKSYTSFNPSVFSVYEPKNNFFLSVPKRLIWTQSNTIVSSAQFFALNLAKFDNQKISIVSTLGRPFFFFFVSSRWKILNSFFRLLLKASKYSVEESTQPNLIRLYNNWDIQLQCEIGKNVFPFTQQFPNTI